MFIKRFVTGMVTGSLILTVVLPAAADTHRGGRSRHKTSEKCTQEVTQSSKTDARISLYVVGNSGKNTANGNKGKVKIKTGKVTNMVDVGVMGGSNEATLPDCCCNDKDGYQEGGVYEVFNGENGYKYKKGKKPAKKETKVEVKQESKTEAEIMGTIKGNTGLNEAKYNHAGKKRYKYGHWNGYFGDYINGEHEGEIINNKKKSGVRIKTGRVLNMVGVHVTGGHNTLNP